MTIRSENLEGGKVKYILDVKIAFKRRRLSFPTKREAEEELLRLKKDIKENGESVAQYSMLQRAEWIYAQEIANNSGFSVVDACSHYARYKARPPITEGFRESITHFLAYKKPRIGKGYSNLKSMMNRFSRELAVKKVMDCDEDILFEWINGLTSTKANSAGEPVTSTTKNQYLKEIKSYFKWAKAQRMIAYSPAGAIGKFQASQDELEEKENRKEILTFRESEEMMHIVQRDFPDMAARVAALLFAGVRPEREAPSIRYEDIDFEGNTLHIRARYAKDRQDRYIDMPENLVAWFKWSLEKGYTLPTKNWDNRWDEIKPMVTSPWPHDACRHSFASYYLALNSEESTIKALGHGDHEMLFKNYRTLVKKDQANKYFDIVPC